MEKSPPSRRSSNWRLLNDSELCNRPYQFGIRTQFPALASALPLVDSSDSARSVRPAGDQERQQDERSEQNRWNPQEEERKPEPEIGSVYRIDMDDCKVRSHLRASSCLIACSAEISPFFSRSRTSAFPGEGLVSMKVSCAEIRLSRALMV